MAPTVAQPVLAQTILSSNTTAEALLTPTDEQWTTIYVLIGYIVGILILWHLPYLKELLKPFKIITVAFHEFGHLSAGKCTGAKIEGMEVNPDEGGVTKMRGGNPYITLPAGYIGSAFWGALAVFAGFNVLASKIVSVILGICLLIVLFYAKNWLTRIISIAFVGVMVGFWFLEEGRYLRYFVLFFGAMSGCYALWDIVDDLITRRVNESDASQFSKLCCGGCLPPQFWGLLWFLISLLFLAAAVVLALIAFKET